MVFRMLQDGQRKDLNDFTTATPNPATGQKEIWDNFMGAPSLYFVFAVPQDGFTTPADFNATVSGYLRTIWNGSATGAGAGTLTGPDADGYYTGTLTGVTIPTSAVMLTGGLGYSYNCTSTLPLTQTNLAKYPVAAPTASPAPACASSPTNVCKQGGLIVIAPNVNKVATGFSARRPIVEDARCNKCHQELGTFTEDAFHAGQRNDGTTCAWCHTPNRTSSGWSADSVYFVHAIHGGAKRSTEFTWHAESATSSFADVKYPGSPELLRGLPHPRRLRLHGQRVGQRASPAAPHVATGTSWHRGTATTGCTGRPSSSWPRPSVFALSPYVMKDNATSYGSGFSVTGAGATDAAPTTLVNSPIATQCFACHDSADASAHMEVNGGSIYTARSGRAGHDRDLHGLPRHRTHCRHQGHAHEVIGSCAMIVHAARHARSPVRAMPRRRLRALVVASRSRAQR